MPKTSSSMKQKFLDKPNIKELPIADLRPFACIDAISPEDEIWLVQCPRSVDIEQLCKQKIKLPGKSSHNLIETVAEELLNDLQQTIAYKAQTGELSLRTLPIKGRVLVREKLKPIKIEEHLLTSSGSLKHKGVPFPKNLKIRHPLHGANYEDRITVSHEVQNILQQERQTVEVQEGFEKRKRMEKANRRKNNEPHLTQTDKQNYSNSIVSTQAVETPRKKKKDKIKSEPIDTDLAWINTI